MSRSMQIIYCILFTLVSTGGYCSGNLPINLNVNAGIINAENNGEFISAEAFLMGSYYDGPGIGYGFEAQNINNSAFLNINIGALYLKKTGIGFIVFKGKIGAGKNGIVLNPSLEYALPSERVINRFILYLGYQKYNNDDDMSGAKLGVGYYF